MREIKFRCWDKKTNKYIEDVHIYLDGNFREFWDDDCGKSGMWEHDCSKNENLILEQYTGLKDKNGKEIYEGDIVEMRLRENIGTFNVPDDIIANGGYTGREDVYKGDVVFENQVGYFGINDKDSGVVGFMPGEDTIIEIVGNIYENQTC